MPDRPTQTSVASLLNIIDAQAIQKSILSTTPVQVLSKSGSLHNIDFVLACDVHGRRALLIAIDDEAPLATGVNLSDLLDKEPST